ncbi:type II toxin-antitoxin system RelE/ParE family toxin [Sulfuricurvum sp.]|uniref:type II toxin-antitoxin system RelE/ParE family toxin n=1 Tax=Sulfuricurvum sp. TaxID=2025608 RepID=UPI0026071A22|nr:type II toxin-antitoxin system RelE/ParE family toxin [Sulfuricurvum sp.]MDD3596755.1 type II toxin-antitoxin system RelE/ParE family toxin [Sulfuricurvum sp.]
MERSEKFAEDLENILIFIAKDSKPSAHQFANELYKTLYSIEPYLYKYRKSIYFDDESIRDCIFKGYVIPYKIFESKIVLLGITKYRRGL